MFLASFSAPPMGVVQDDSIRHNIGVETNIGPMLL